MGELYTLEFHLDIGDGFPHGQPPGPEGISLGGLGLRADIGYLGSGAGSGDTVWDLEFPGCGFSLGRGFVCFMGQDSGWVGILLFDGSFGGNLDGAPGRAGLLREGALGAAGSFL